MHSQQILSDAKAVLQRYYLLSQGVKSLGAYVEANNIALKTLNKKQKDFDIKESLYNSSIEVFKKIVDEVYSRNLGEIQETLNIGLQYVFFDKNYGASIEVSDFKTKTIELYLLDRSVDPPRKSDMKDGVGNGVRSVVSFILLVFYLIRCGRKRLIFADEAYSAISETYVDKFFSFASSLCEKKGLTLVLITHDPRFLIYADKRYSVSDGKVLEILEDIKK